MEEEIFYPAVREGIDDEDLMDEADVEHASAKELIEEENESMFPQARKAGVDLADLGAQIKERKAELGAG